jgi:hypothetical protein
MKPENLTAVTLERLKENFKEEDRPTVEWIHGITHSSLYARIIWALTLSCAALHPDWTFIQVLTFIKKNNATLDNMIMREMTKNARK